MEFPDEIAEISNVPLQHRRAFGTGLKRKRIDFVPATSKSTLTEPHIAGRSASDLYLSIVLPRSGTDKPATSQTSDLDKNLCLSSPNSVAAEEHLKEERAICPICGNAIKVNDDGPPHEASLSHQVALQHSHPPSALDRHRLGLKQLEKRGWDPDSRSGLGLAGEGRLYPVTAKLRENNRGIGARREVQHLQARPKVQKLDVSAMKTKANQNKIRDQKLHDLFYGRDDMEQYLGRES